MNWLEALLLGLLQGLTEFLPVSSSGHLEIGQAILKTEAGENLTFAIVVHGATVLSTIVVFFAEIKKIARESILFQWNESTKFVVKILISMIPVGIVGLLFKDFVESLFTGNIRFVGFMLLITAFMLFLAGRIKTTKKDVSYLRAFIIGIMQAVAVLPGISRSGATISTALLLGVNKDMATRFSFLMVLIPILGINLLDTWKYWQQGFAPVETTALFAGFISAFISGVFACKVMIHIVKKGRLIYFAVYCALVGITAILI